jgi:hypothetical protein
MKRRGSSLSNYQLRITNYIVRFLMTVENVQQLAVRAVQQAYDAWAAGHPSLASVIDRIELTQQTLESLQPSQPHRDAVAAYYKTGDGPELLRQLTELARPIFAGILAG